MLLWAMMLFRYVYPAKNDYVPRSLWDDLLGRFQKLVSQPDPNSEFRGSLVDENMFAIDLREWGLENVLEAYRAKRLASMEAERLKKCG